MAVVLIRRIILLALVALGAFALDIAAAFAQEPEPTPTPAPVTTRRNLTVSVDGQVAGYVYPNGVTLWLVRFLLSAGDDSVTARFPDAASVVTFALTPDPTSHAHGHEVLINPAIVPGTTGDGAKGWGRGLALGVCHCYRGLASAEQAAELALDWTLTTELNPEYVTNPSSVGRDVSLAAFMEIDEYDAPEAAVRAALTTVNRDQPAALFDGRFLSQAGEIYLASYSVDLEFLLPDLYARGSQPIEIPTPGTFSAVEIPVAGIDSDITELNPVELAIEGTQAFTGLGQGDVLGLGWAAIAITLTIVSAVLTKNAIFPVCVLTFVLLAGVTFGWTPMWVAAVLIAMSAIGLGWILWLKKGVGA